MWISHSYEWGRERETVTLWWRGETEVLCVCERQRQHNVSGQTVVIFVAGHCSPLLCVWLSVSLASDVGHSRTCLLTYLHKLSNNARWCPTVDSPCNKRSQRRAGVPSVYPALFYCGNNLPQSWCFRYIQKQIFSITLVTVFSNF